jgi:hypothetical protein
MKFHEIVNGEKRTDSILYYAERKMQVLLARLEDGVEESKRHDFDGNWRI